MENLEDKTIIVTGASGMLGRELTRQLLDTGAKLRLVVRDKARVNFSDKIEIVECELTNPIELEDAFKGADIVFNCAAKVSFKFDEIEEIIHTNTDIAKHVVNACLKERVSLLVHVSSIAALGISESSKLIDESCFPETISGWNGYSMSKYYSENEVWRGFKSGLNTVIVNPSVILGVGRWKGVGSAALFATYASGMPFYTDGVTGYVDVRDVARAMITLAGESNKFGGRRFILSAANLSYKEIITKVAMSVGKRPPRFKAGVGLLNFVKLFSSKLTDGLIKTAITKSYYSNNAIREMGFKFTPIDDTIRYIANEYMTRRR